MLDFEECEVSGQLKAEGEKGAYWLCDSEGFTLLERVTVDAAGPNTEKLGKFYDTLEASIAAEQFDNQT